MRDRDDSNRSRVPGPDRGLLRSSPDDGVELMGGRHRHEHGFLRNLLLIIALFAGAYIVYQILNGVL